MIRTRDAAGMRALHKIARQLPQLLYWWLQSWHSVDVGDRFNATTKPTFQNSVACYIRRVADLQTGFRPTETFRK
jgi:hypothetical protein